MSAIINPFSGIGGAITGGTTGSVLFINPTNILAQDNSNFFYDDTLNSLFLGTTSSGFVDTGVLNINGNLYFKSIGTEQNRYITSSSLNGDDHQDTIFIAGGANPGTGTGNGGSVYVIGGNSTNGTSGSVYIYGGTGTTNGDQNVYIGHTGGAVQGKVIVGGTTSTGRMTVHSGANGTIALAVTGTASQTADVIRCTVSSATAGITSALKFYSGQNGVQAYSLSIGSGGSAASPAFQITAFGVGMYASASNTLGFSTNSTEAISISSAQLVTISSQLSVPTSGTGAGILIGGDTQIYRRTTNIMALASGDSLEIPSYAAVGTTIDTTVKLLVQDTTVTTGISGIFSNINMNSATASDRPWGLKFQVTQSGGTSYSSALGATGMEGLAINASSGTSEGCCGGIFYARNSGAGTLVRATGILINSNENTGIGSVTNSRLLDIAAGGPAITANNQTRLSLRFGIAPDPGAFTGTISRIIQINSDVTGLRSAIHWGTAASSTANLYLLAANTVATDGTFSVGTALTTPLATFPLINTTATTIQFGGAATTFTIGAATSATTWTGQSFSITGANSTNNTTLTVINTSNAAAASHSIADVQVGGTTSTGDPQIRLTIPSGTSWHIGVDNSDSDLLKIGTGTTVGSSGVVTISSTAVSPSTNDVAALGTTALMWADLFLASGSVINWNNGDVTLTHAADMLTLAGGGLDAGGATSLEVPNGAGGTTVDATGEVTVDSTSRTLNFHDGTAEVVLNPIQSKSITVESPTSSEDLSIFYTDDAITITKMVFVITGSTSATTTIRHHTDRSNAGNEVVTGGTTANSTTTGNVVTSFNDATVPADSFVWLETTALSGTPTTLSVTIFFRQDA